MEILGGDIWNSCEMFFLNICLTGDSTCLWMGASLHIQKSVMVCIRGRSWVQFYSLMLYFLQGHIILRHWVSLQWNSMSQLITLKSLHYRVSPTTLAYRALVMTVFVMSETGWDTVKLSNFQNCSSCHWTQGSDKPRPLFLLQNLIKPVAGNLGIFIWH